MSIFGIGTVVVDHAVELPDFPRADTKSAVRRHWQQIGGPVPVALSTAAFYGSQCAFLGRWGNDSGGQFIRDGLQSRGIDLTQSRTEPDWSTGFAHVWTEPAGTRTIAFSRGDFPQPASKDITPEDVRPHALLHLDGWAGELARHAAELMKHQDGCVVLDAGSVKPGTRELLPYVDVLIASDLFCRSWFTAETTHPRSLLETGCGAVVLTHGAEGATVITREQQVRVPGHRVRAVDTNGAGDIFSGAVLNRMDQGADLVDAVRFANAAAALACEHYGNSTLATRDRVHEFRETSDRGI